MSSSTIETVSSVTSVLEVLQSCSEDAEETLFQLGFGCDEMQVPARVPVRFFTFPSQLEGINFRLFLQSQLQRTQDEDPDLSIASRFRQVEVLTTMANAFYSLYSHVSRTPLPKLTLPEPSLCLSPSPVEKLDRFRIAAWGGSGDVRSEPRSPVERLKDMVSKMCLYTGGARRDPPRRSPGLPEVVSIVLETTRLRPPKKLDFSGSSLNVRPHGDKEEEEEHRQPTAATDVPTPQSGNTGRRKAVATGHPSDTVESDLNGVKPWSDLDKNMSVDFIRSSSLASSGETASQTKRRHALSEPGGNAVEHSTCGIKVSRDVLFPAIVENVHHHHGSFRRSPVDDLPQVS